MRSFAPIFSRRRRSPSLSSADFYATLAEHYDELFGTSEDGLAFLREEGARPGRRVLDVACGTGAWVRRLAGEEVDVYGVDLSAEMIERGRAIARSEGVDPDRLRAGDMMRIDAHPRGPFDLVYCIGNSIAHLAATDEVRGFVATTANALHDGGTVVLQYVTVSGLTVGEEFELPSLDAPGATMRRTYRRLGPSDIEFDAVLEIDGEPPQSISQRLLVIDDETMLEALRATGFGSAELYSGFDRSSVDAAWVRVARGRL